MLLTATRHGLAASFRYQPIELDEIRMRDGWWLWPEQPQMIIRLGYGRTAAGGLTAPPALRPAVRPGGRPVAPAGDAVIFGPGSYVGFRGPGQGRRDLPGRLGVLPVVVLAAAQPGHARRDEAGGDGEVERRVQSAGERGPDQSWEEAAAGEHGRLVSGQWASIDVPTRCWTGLKPKKAASGDAKAGTCSVPT